MSKQDVDTMKDVSHTHPFDDRAVQTVFRRGVEEKEVEEE